MATPLPTSTPKPSPTRAPAVSVYEGQVTIPTYPYAQFTTEGRNEALHFSFPVLDRGAYEASDPVPVDISYRALVMENEYLKLTILPDLGGRIYEVVYKPTGHRETYRNPVLKPSPWGPPEQGWWLAAGGIEWCFPVEEHGYEWGVPWTAQVAQDATGATVTLRDTTAGDRVRAAVAVRLEAGSAAFEIMPTVENPTSTPQEVKYWTNAMLAPGGRNAPSAATRFVLPDAVTAVTVHSRGDTSLPAPNGRMSWPVYNGRDLSLLGNWSSWLGVFEDPAIGDFAAVYDESYDEGMVRVAPSGVTRGVKIFGFGWSNPLSSSNWTDDGSSYVELHGGLAPTFGSSVVLQPGGQISWAESWYPVAGLGSLRYANEVAALNLRAGDGQAQIGIAVTRPWSGTALLLLNGQEQWRAQLTLLPGQPFQTGVPLGEAAPQTGELALSLQGENGAIVASYNAELTLR